jgi:DUF4097 and DUF4098 domain-containing protein YvlB
MPTFETPQPISVGLELGVGDIRIEASDRPQTVVEVTPSDPGRKADVAAAEQTTVEHANGHLSVQGPSGWRQWHPRKGSGSIQVRIAVPTGSSVSAEVGVATLRGRGRLGACRYEAGVGDVHLDESGSLEVKLGAGDATVERAAGTVNVVTRSGDVRIGSIQGSGVVKNSNGDTWIGEVTGEARVRAANGTISVDRAHQGVVAKTANGAIRLGEVERGAAVAESAFGDLEVGIRDGVSAWLDLHTKLGQVRNDLDASDSPGPEEDTVEVHASTSMGDILIRRSP